MFRSFGRTEIIGILVSVLAGGVGGLLLALFGDRVRYTVSGDRTLDGDWRFVAEPVAAGALESIDLHQVHAELLPSWARAVVDGGGVEERERLLASVQPDPNLVGMVQEMDALARDGVVRHAEQLLYLSWAWSTYLDRRGQPWRLAGSVHVVGTDHVFRLQSYRVLADVDVDVGADPWRTRLLARVDDSKTVESFLGSTSRRDREAVVVVDRVVNVAVDQVWPLMDRGTGEYLSPMQRAFAPAMRQAALDALGEETLAPLRRTAADRQLLVRVVEDIRERTPCSRMTVGPVGWSGFSMADLDRMRRYAAADRDRPCPSVTEHEAMALDLLSPRLREEPGLEVAVERLAAWVARAVAVHEARHVADQVDGLQCSTCDGLEADAVAELSAYTAAVAHPTLGVVALYQACSQADRARGGHEPAIRELIEALLPEGCVGGPPPDVGRRAVELETTLFGRSSPIRVAETWPARLPVD